MSNLYRRNVFSVIAVAFVACGAAPTAQAQTNVSFIEEIYNNTDHTFVMWVRDKAHLGVFRDKESGKKLGSNNKRNGKHTDFIIQPNARIRAHWCGIPWYHRGSHYRVIAEGRNGDRVRKQGLKIYQARIDGGDYIHLVDNKWQNDVGKIQLKGKKTRHFKLMIQPLDMDKPGGKYTMELRLTEANDDVAQIVAYYKETGKKLQDLVGQVIAGKAKKR